MGLSPQLAAILLCLLACTRSYAGGQDGTALKEIIHTLNQVTEKGVSTLSGTISPDTQVTLSSSFLSARRTEVLERSLAGGWGRTRDVASLRGILPRPPCRQKELSQGEGMKGGSMIPLACLD